MPDMQPVSVPPESPAPRFSPARLLRILRWWARLRLDADEEEVAQSMKNLVAIKNARLWFLVASAVIASVGLNTNSAAVVIGAMLVSPLMGPLVGMGYAMATLNRRLTIISVQYLGVSVFISLLVSTLYFLLTPLDELTPELLARTQPTLLDLAVAVAAALAGVIALASRDVSATLPGVAIATAIMPPLCTTGYGIANGEPSVALGSFYLFVVNGVAIVLASLFLFRRMHLAEQSEESGQRVPKATMIALTIVFLAPLTWTLYQLSMDSARRKAATEVVEWVGERYSVANWQYVKEDDRPHLSLFLFGSPSELELESLQAEIELRLPDTQIRLQTTSLEPAVRETIDKLQSSVIDSQTALRRIEDAVEQQRAQAAEAAALTPRFDGAALTQEWRMLEPSLRAVEYFQPVTGEGTWLVRAALARPVKGRARKAFIEKWQPWVRLRAGHPLELIPE